MKQPSSNAFRTQRVNGPVALGRAETRLSGAVWFAAAILVFWSCGYAVVMGSDLWWHLAAGKWLATGWRWPLTDPWSFTSAGQPWNYHTWLAGLLYHGWACLLGVWSLVWWKWLMIVATYGLLMILLWRLTRQPLAGFLGAALAAATATPLLDIRPNLYGWLGTALLLLLVLAPPKPSRWIPLLFLFWVNFHGSFVFGLTALSLIWAVDALAERRPFPVWLWLASLGACLLNPSGAGAFARPLHFVLNPGSPFLRVAEWRPPYEQIGLSTPLYPYCIGAFFLAVLALGVTRRRLENRRAALCGLALGLLTLVMSLKSLRFVPLFALVASICVSQALAAAIDAIRRRWGEGPDPLGGRSAKSRTPSLARERIWKWAPPLTALLVGAALMIARPVAPGVFVSLTQADRFPVEALNFAEANQLSGNVFAFYSWGGYLNHRSEGRLKVFIDGRIDQVFEADVYRRYLQVVSREGNWTGVIESSGADYLLWPYGDDTVPVSLLRTRRWELLYHDLTAVLLVRAGKPVPKKLLPTPAGPYREMKLGFDAWAARRLDEAESHFERAVRLLPWMASGWENLAAIQQYRGNPQKAAKTRQRAGEVFPFPFLKSDRLARRVFP